MLLGVFNLEFWLFFDAQAITNFAPYVYLGEQHSPAQHHDDETTR